MFTIKNLKVKVAEKEILKGVNLEINPGEIHAIMGPNGAGKSSLAESLMGHPSLETTGSIILNGDELIDLPVDQRAKKGVFLAFQNPEEVEGVKVSNFVRKAISSIKETQTNDLDEMVKIHEELIENAQKLGMDKSFVSREMNVGFSGGEKKRAEMLQMLSLKPKIIILDEIDSGLDVDGIKMVSNAISKLNDGTRCFLIITHYPRILKHIKPNFVHVLADGKIVLSGDERLAHEIEEHGYAKYVKGRA